MARSYLSWTYLKRVQKVCGVRAIAREHPIQLSPALAEGELLTVENFGLQDSMGAVEVHRTQRILKAPNALADHGSQNGQRSSKPQHTSLQFRPLHVHAARGSLLDT